MIGTPYVLHTRRRIDRGRTLTLNFTVTFECCGRHVTGAAPGVAFTSAGMASAAALEHQC
jgi:hypothetical protein